MKFNLREVFLLLLAIGLGLGWFLDHRRLAIENHKILASLEILLLLDPSERPTLDEILKAGEASLGRTRK